MNEIAAFFGNYPLLNRFFLQRFVITSINTSSQSTTTAQFGDQWVVSVQWNYFYKLEYLSLMVVQVSLNGLKRCTKILYVNIIERFGIPVALANMMNEIAAFFGNYPLLNMRFFTKIRNHVDKYVITKHYYQLMPLSLATYPQASPQAMPQGK
ncbi:hypothetical protein T07_507 [Trichinella nelsoni]|uniref:Uncharacterized protein n=1 Tax=Trichinella nelsoni TaxID=6336 RepID=A0A0V0SBC6_9BILA|nr:hypothetical protein T07_507 [Trichinella nelsoni]